MSCKNIDLPWNLSHNDSSCIGIVTPCRKSCVKLSSLTIRNFYTSRHVTDGVIMPRLLPMSLF